MTLFGARRSLSCGTSRKRNETELHATFHAPV